MIAIALLMVLTCCLCWSDIQYRHLNNYLILSVALLSVLATGGSAFSFISWLMAAGIGCVLFGCKVLAGGDVKLILAFLPGIQLTLWWDVFLIMAFSGGVLAMFYLGYGLIMQCLADIRQRGLPYGVAIGLAGYLGVCLTVLEPVIH